MTRPFDRSSPVPPPGPRDVAVGPLAGFDRLKANLDRVVARAVVGRLRDGQSADAIRSEVPLAAAREAAGLYPHDPAFEESVHAYAAGRVDAELAVWTADRLGE